MEEMKRNWDKGTLPDNVNGFLSKGSLQRIVKEKSNQQRNISMQYFWGSFTLQLIVYAYLSHLIIRYWTDYTVLLPSTVLLILYIPFTVILMKKFKALAVLRPGESHSAGLPIRNYVERQHKLLSEFYGFKRRYEAILGLLSILVLIWIPFRIYVPGGVQAYPVAALLIFFIAWISCALIVRNENKKYFKRPLRRLEQILYDLNH